MKELCEIIKRTNDFMRSSGFTQEIQLSNEHFTITGEEVIIKMPFILTLKIPKEELGSDTDIQHAVNHAISQAVSVAK